MTWHRYTWLLWARTLDGQRGKAWFATSVLGAALPSALGSRDMGGLVPFPLKPTVALALGSLCISGACDRGQRCPLMGTPSQDVHLWQHGGRWHWACLVAKEKVLLWVGSLPAREPRVWAASQSATAACVHRRGPGPARRQRGRPGVRRPPSPCAQPAAAARGTHGTWQEASGCCRNPSSLAPAGLAPTHRCPGSEPVSRSWTPRPGGAAKSSWGSTSTARTTRPPGTRASPSSGPGEPPLSTALRVSRGWWLRAGEGPRRV